jgi:choline dehydrogenase-like flavoprotein
VITDTRLLPDGHAVETDVCIVGAGPAGITLGLEFRDRPFRVCLLESGGWRPAPATEDLNTGENAGLEYPLERSRSRAFAGSANQWNVEMTSGTPGARFRPLDSFDFEERDWVPHSGWPFGPVDLRPFYERAQAVCGLGPLAYDVEDWPSTADGVAGERIRSTIFQYGAADMFTDRHRREILDAPNIELFLDASVISLQTDPSGQHVTRVQALTPDGHRLSIAASLFILAAGGIENPRLLLASDGVHPAGLGNEHDLVGRFFMEHPHLLTGFLVPSDPSLVDKLPKHAMHQVDGVHVQRKLTLHEEVFSEERILNYMMRLSPVPWSRQVRYLATRRAGSPGVESLKALRAAVLRRRRPPALGRHLANVLTGLDDIALSAGAKLRWRIREGLSTVEEGDEPQLFELIAISEQAPNPESRVTLSPKTDRLGLRRARLTWRLQPLDVRTLLRAQEIMETDIERSGLGVFYGKLTGEDALPKLAVGHHHMGTTRMHADPTKGVVDENCRVHGLSNLHLAGSSVFPTGGVSNPTLTIVALAARLAEHVIALLQSGSATTASGSA